MKPSSYLVATPDGERGPFTHEETALFVAAYVGTKGEDACRRELVVSEASEQDRPAKTVPLDRFL